MRVERMRWECLRVTVDGELVIVQLHRPERRNALNAAMADELGDALSHFRDARSLVVTGDEHAFSSGWDLAGADGGGPVPEHRSEPLGDWAEVTDRLAQLPMPTIAAIEGWCLGGGLALALACDFRVASENARFGMPEVRRGLFPAMATTWRLPRLVGRSRAKLLLMLAEPIDGVTAATWGLVDTLTAPGSTLDEATGLSQALQKGAPLALQAVKELVDRSEELTTEEFLALEFATSARIAGSLDAQEGIRAFLDRRPPRFTME